MEGTERPQGRGWLLARVFFLPFSQSLVLKRCGGLQKKETHTHTKKKKKKNVIKKPNKRVDGTVMGSGVGERVCKAGWGFLF